MMHLFAGMTQALVPSSVTRATPHTHARACARARKWVECSVIVERTTLTVAVTDGEVVPLVAANAICYMMRLIIIVVLPNSTNTKPLKVLAV